MRLTPEELLMLRLSLGLDEDADPHGSPVAGLFSDEPMGGFAPFEHADASRTVVDLLLRAETEQRRVEWDYAGLGETEFSTRTVHPYQIVNNRGGCSSTGRMPRWWGRVLSGRGAEGGFVINICLLPCFAVM